ncbi:MAG TPA: D-amino acid aminotransferase [Gammaproteobacteria bacterium]|nr:D-amino acid aminotransferase [Gammaproteobacteria bacterium]
MPAPLPVAYLNGAFLPLADARVTPLDRGFLFGDSVYEVVPVYAGRLFLLDPHLDRLARSLLEIRLADPMDREAWIRLLDTLIARNEGGDMAVYMQVTRGADSQRDHRMPRDLAPTVFAMATPFDGVPQATREHGIAAVVLEDTRWGRCDIKSTGLLANVLLRAEAEDAGAQEAILVRDGHVTEGASSSVFVIADGVVRTPPNGPELLPGTTRDLVIALAHDAGLPVEEARFAPEALAGADEIWISSAMREVLAVTRLDGEPVGDGRPGPLWRQIFERYQAYKQQFAT